MEKYKKFTIPEIEIINFCEKDIITGSGGEDDMGEGTGDSQVIGH